MTVSGTSARRLQKRRRDSLLGHPSHPGKGWWNDEHQFLYTWMTNSTESMEGQPHHEEAANQIGFSTLFEGHGYNALWIDPNGEVTVADWERVEREEKDEIIQGVLRFDDRLSLGDNEDMWSFGKIREETSSHQELFSRMIPEHRWVA